VRSVRAATSSPRSPTCTSGSGSARTRRDTSIRCCCCPRDRPYSWCLPKRRALWLPLPPPFRGLRPTTGDRCRRCSIQCRSNPRQRRSTRPWTRHRRPIRWRTRRSSRPTTPRKSRRLRPPWSTPPPGFSTPRALVRWTRLGRPARWSRSPRRRRRRQRRSTPSTAPALLRREWWHPTHQLPRRPRSLLLLLDRSCRRKRTLPRQDRRAHRPLTRCRTHRPEAGFPAGWICSAIRALRLIRRRKEGTLWLRTARSRRAVTSRVAAHSPRTRRQPVQSCTRRPKPRLRRGTPSRRRGPAPPSTVAVRVGSTCFFPLRP
jgi:hypothetical protein